jgi:hypothetical protein
MEISTSPEAMGIVFREPSETDIVNAWIEFRTLARESISLEPTVFQKTSQAILEDSYLLIMIPFASAINF